MVTRPRLWLKTTSEKGPHLSCVVFTDLGTLDFWGQAQLEGDRATTAIWELEIFQVAGPVEK